MNTMIVDDVRSKGLFAILSGDMFPAVAEGGRSYLQTREGRNIALPGRLFETCMRIRKAAADDAAESELLAEPEIGALCDRIGSILSTRSSDRNFLFRKDLLPAGLVDALSLPFTMLFTPAGATLAGITMLIGLTTFFLTAGANSAFEFDHLFLAYLLFLASSVVHELGHAAACRRFGLRPGAIGVGSYWFMPVFYSDVTQIWRLDRWRRIVVNLGGIYLQILVAVIYGLLAATTHMRMFLEAESLIVIHLIVVLNPILRSDGYWVFADTIAVHDLRRKPIELALFVLRSLRMGKLPNLRERFGNAWPLICIYAAAIPLLWLQLLAVLRSTLFAAPQTVSQLPAIVHDLLTMPGLPTTYHLLSTLLKLIVPALVAFTAIRIVVNVVTAILQRSTESTAS